VTHYQQISQFIQRNRVSTTEVADALGKSGVVPEVRPLTSDLFRVGKVRCIFTAHNSNFALHDQFREIEEGEVAMVFTHDCEGRAVMGELVAKYALLYRGASAIVVDGLVRDAANLRRNRFAVWSRGSTPLGAYNTPAAPFPPEREAELRAIYDGGIAVCDDGGVTVIPQSRVDADMLERLERIELQEDLWFFCLDVLKWDTKKIVCEKAYLAERSVVPEAFLEHIHRLESPLDKKTP
jgi:4-hydroxy-4-methyl-2-oxoglutarate aldolase